MDWSTVLKTIYIHGERKVKSWFDLPITSAHFPPERKNLFASRILSTAELHLHRSGAWSLCAFHDHVSCLHIDAESKTRVGESREELAACVKKSNQWATACVGASCVLCLMANCLLTASNLCFKESDQILKLASLVFNWPRWCKFYFAKLNFIQVRSTCIKTSTRNATHANENQQLCFLLLLFGLISIHYCNLIINCSFI